MYPEGRGSPQEPTLHVADVHALSKHELHTLVGEWTLILKKQGVPPEKVLVTVKTLVRNLIVPHIARYEDIRLADVRTTVIADASRSCIDLYFQQAGARPTGRRRAATANPIARKSQSRKLLVKLLVMRPDLACTTLASQLSVGVRQLASFATATQLMPIDVQRRLAAFVIDSEPRLARLARRLERQTTLTRREAQH